MQRFPQPFETFGKRSLLLNQVDDSIGKVMSIWRCLIRKAVSFTGSTACLAIIADGLRHWINTRCENFGKLRSGWE